MSANKGPFETLPRNRSALEFQLCIFFMCTEASGYPSFKMSLKITAELIHLDFGRWPQLEKVSEESETQTKHSSVDVAVIPLCLYKHTRPQILWPILS